MRRFAVAGILASLALATLTAAAGAAGSTLTITPAGPVAFPGRAFTLTLPKKAQIDPSQVTVLENGQPVDSLFVGLPGGGGGRAGTVVLLDASNSMRGAPIAGAMAAARTFASKRNPGQELAVLTFNDKVDTLLPFTTASADITAALASPPRLREKTHIYDALAEALDLMRKGEIAAGSIVLLSDGTDIGSTSTQASVVKLLASAHVRVFSVGLRSGQFDPKALRSLADSTGGSYAEATSAAALKPIFGQLGSRLANEYIVTYRSLIGPRKAVSVRVEVAGIKGAATSTYATPKLQSVSATLRRSSWDKIVTSWVTAVLVAFFVVGLGAYAIFSVARGPDIALRRRMSQFVHVATDEEARARRAEIANLLARRAERSLANRQWWKKFSEECEIADIQRAPMSLLIWALLGSLAIGVILALIVGSPLAIILGLPFGPIVLRLWVSGRLRHKRNDFADQLPDNLDVLASALRAGHSLVGALSVVVSDASEPSKSEFQRVIADEQLGVPLDEALHVTVERMDNRDLEQVAVVAALQRDTGGNSAEVLDRVAENIRGRQEIRRLIRTLTAQGRMARWIVSLLPAFLFCFIFLINRDYLRPLWTKTLGEVAVGLAIAAILLGSYVIKRIIEIKV
jgi:tight adherence protein B